MRRLGSRRAAGAASDDGGEEGTAVASPAVEARPAPGDTGEGRRGIETVTSERKAPDSGVEPPVDDASSRAAAGWSASEPRPAPSASGVADPAPLGLGALALTTLVLSLFNAGLLDEAGVPVVFGVALAYGGIAQLLAGMWEFRTGNTFAATAFSSYGAFWISFFLLEVFFADEVPAAEMPVYMGWLLVAWALFTTYMYIASFKLTGAVNVVFLLLGATLFLLGIGELTSAEIVTRVGGFVGIATALAAGYASFAVVTDATFKQRVLPVREPWQSGSDSGRS